jgi:hypothetical protein
LPIVLQSVKTIDGTGAALIRPASGEAIRSAIIVPVHSSHPENPIKKGAPMARISKGQLEKLQKKYTTDEAIGKLFGISRQAIHQLRTTYAIAPVENKHGERDADMVKQYREGVSGTKLAKKFKLSVSQAYRIINERDTKPAKNTKRK